MILRLHYPDGPPVSLPLEPEELEDFADRRPGGIVEIKLQNFTSIFVLRVRSSETLACRWIGDEMPLDSAS